MQLYSWKVFLVKADFNNDGDSIHFVGDSCVGFPEGRVTSPIQEFDMDTMRGVSRSGRVYELLGNSARLSGNAEYVFENWLRINGNPGFEDISNQF